MLTAIDPATDETLPLKELAERYSTTYHTIRMRQLEGLEGWELVQPARKINPREAMRLKAIAIEHTNRNALMRFLRTPQGRLTTRLFKDFGRIA